MNSNASPIGYVKFGKLKVNLLQGSFPTANKTGKVKFNDFHFTMKVNKASAKLFKFCATGKHIPKVTVTMRKAGGTKPVYIKVTLENVVISSFQESSGGAKNEKPQETLTLNFTKVEY